MRLRLCWALFPLLPSVWGCFAHRVPPDLVIEHVTVVNVLRGGLELDRTITIAGSRILHVGAAGRNRLEPRTATLDGRGKFVIPGLWDMHVHLDSLALVPLLAHGITGVRDMGNSTIQLMELRRAIRTGLIAGPRIVLAGPRLVGGSTTSSESRVAVATAPQGIRAVDSLASLGVDFIKIHDAIPRDAYFAIAREARAKGIVFSGHVPADVTPAEASDSGQKSIEHLEFIPKLCMALFSASQPSPVLAARCSTDSIAVLTQRFARNHTWLGPTISMFRAYVTPAAYNTIFAGFRRLVPMIRASGVRLLVGTDMENSRIMAGESLHDEMELLVKAGYSRVEVLRGATFDAADFLGMSDSIGTVAAGKIADLVLLDGNPLLDIRGIRRISAVVLNGRVVFRAVQ